jgi:hypothetical protein
MPALTIADLNNGKRDLDHIAEVATSIAPTATDRLGNVRPTVHEAVYSLKAFNPRGAFVAASEYEIKDVYTSAGIAYAVVAAHIATTVAADLAAGKVVVHQGATREDLGANDQTQGSSIIVQPTEFPGEQPTAVFSILRGRANIKRFWAPGDGGDWTNAFKKASLSGARNIIVPGDVLYNAGGQIDILDDQDWYFDNAQVTLTDATKVLFAAVQKKRWGIRGRSFLYGSLAGAATAVETGLMINGASRYVVEGLTAAKFRGRGIHLLGDVNPGALRGDRGQFMNVGAHENTLGIEVAPGAASEYNSWTNTNVSGNVDGWLMAAGNNTVNGGSIVDNTRDGLKLAGGANHCHGMFSTVNINHNARWNLWAEAVQNGHSFSGCHFYGNGSDGAGAIFLDRSKGINISGGHLDCQIYNYKDAGSGLNIIENMYCPGSYGVSRKPGSNDGHDELVIRDCYGPGSYAIPGGNDGVGVTINDPSLCYAYAEQEPGDLQALTSGVAGTLTWSRELLDRRNVLNVDTGVFTVPPSQAGMYSVEFDAVFNGTDMSATGSYVVATVNGAPRKYCFVAAFSTTKLSAQRSFNIYLSAGDALKFDATIAGTVPSFGDGVVSSSMSINRIA